MGRLVRRRHGTRRRQRHRPRRLRLGRAALLRFASPTRATTRHAGGADIDAVSALHAVPTWTDLGSALAELDGLPLLQHGHAEASSACSLC
jgi:hypothetical protein